MGLPKRRCISGGELVAIAFGHEDGSISREEADAALRRSGFRVQTDDRILMISNSHRWISETLRETAWAKEWWRVLKRLPGAISPKNPQRFAKGESKVRAVALPMGLILDEADTPSN